MASCRASFVKDARSALRRKKQTPQPSPEPSDDEEEVVYEMTLIVRKKRVNTKSCGNERAKAQAAETEDEIPPPSLSPRARYPRRRGA